MTIKVTVHPDLLPDGVDMDSVMMAIHVEDNGSVPHPDVPHGPFDDLQQFIESVAELEEHGFIDMGDDVQIAMDALHDLRQWCNREAQASETNFVLWREATRQLEELQAQL